MIILKIIGLFLWLFLVPLAIGMVPIRYNLISNSYFADRFIKGYFIMLALLELIGIPIVLLVNEGAYTLFCILFGITLLAFSAWGIYSNRAEIIGFSLKKAVNGLMKKILSKSWEERLYIALVLAIILLQVVMSFKYASYDADDFYYNSEALSAQAFGTLYRIDSSTGHNMPPDYRHALAMFPIFQSFISTVTGFHVAVISHTVMPVLLIPLSYLLIYVISKLLFPKRSDLGMIFVLLVAVFRIFGNVSYYTTETFFLIRTWQGKSLAGNFILPGVIFFFLLYYRGIDSKVDAERKIRAVSPLMLALITLASGSSSSLAVLLTCGMTALLSILFFTRNRDIKELFKLLATMIPGVIYILIYVVVR